MLLVLVWFGLDDVDLIQQHHKKFIFSFEKRIKLQLLVQILVRRHVSSTMFSFNDYDGHGWTRHRYFVLFTCKLFDGFQFIICDFDAMFFVGYKLIIHFDARLD